MFGSICRLAQAVPIFIGDRNANFEFPMEQTAHRRSQIDPREQGDPGSESTVQVRAGGPLECAQNSEWHMRERKDPRPRTEP